MSEAATSHVSVPRRQKNWTLDEKMELVRAVGARKVQIFGKFGPTVTNHTKKAAWTDLAASMSDRHENRRTVGQLQEAWRNILKKCRTIYNLHKKHDHRTGELRELG